VFDKTAELEGYSTTRPTCLHNRSKTLRREPRPSGLLNDKCTTSSESILQKTNQTLRTVLQRPPEKLPRSHAGQDKQSTTPQLPARTPLNHFTQLDKQPTFSSEALLHYHVRPQKSILHSMARSESFFFLISKQISHLKEYIHTVPFPGCLKERYLTQRQRKSVLLSAFGGKFFLSWRRPRRRCS
jgi:hypothetical protein